MIVYCVYVRDDFCWISFSPSLATCTIVLQKKFVDKLFANAVKLAISPMQYYLIQGQKL